MSFLDVAKSITEFSLVFITIAALINEEQIANWERKTARKFAKFLKKVLTD